MSFSIPNLADAGFPAQAQVDRVDVDVLVAGHKGDYVASGCAVTAQGSPDMTVAVAVGVVRINGANANVTAGNVTVGAADGTNPRFDLITVNDSGTKACTAGTAAASPVFPSIPANSVVLAAVYVPANDTDIDANQIVDKRVIGEVSSGITEDFTLWNPEAPPVSPGSADDEFSDASGGVPTGWTEVDHDSRLTVTETEAGLVLTETYDAGNDSVAGIYKAIPAGDFTIVAKVSARGMVPSLWWVGIGLWQDATDANGDVMTWGFLVGNLTANKAVWSARNGISSSENAFGNKSYEGWFRIRRNGTSYLLDYSEQGLGWQKCVFAADTLGFTPTHFGPIINNRASGATAVAQFQFFRYVASDVGITGSHSGDRVEMGAN